MIVKHEFRLTPDQVDQPTILSQKIIRKLKLTPQDHFEYRIEKRSLDARKKPVYKLRVVVYVNEKMPADSFKPRYKEVDNSTEVHIIGAGPAGLFAALKLLENGIKPILIERGKDIRSRRKDLVNLMRNHTVDPNSNYCFGEGGAGTYSDGKLYTRSKKKGSVTDLLKKLVYFGAPESILVDAHPHIGTNKLPRLIEKIRQTILDHGGLFHFNRQIKDLRIKDGQITGLVDQNGEAIKVRWVILATGHSATDVYHMLYKNKIALEQKDFAMGVRIEHAQSLINKMQYRCETDHIDLPPASYSLVHRTTERSVYSFCMCPGGVIAPCATSPGEIVTNGWSPSRRNNPFANAGIVVNITSKDTEKFLEHGPLAGLYLRQSIEQKAWLLAGKKQAAPAQRLVDFLEDKKSKSLPPCSYFPGVVSVELKTLFPKAIFLALKQALGYWGKKMPRFKDKEALLVGVETRTSSPVRIPRDPILLRHQVIQNLYPAGEGAGYAGGIISAAIDGERCAQKIAETITSL